MIKTILTLAFLSLSLSTYAQNELGGLIREEMENQNKSAFDSIAKSMGYKDGETIRVYAQFTVNSKGEIGDIKAKGPHRVFEEEAIRIITLVPPIDPPKNLKKGDKARFTLPIAFKIETEKEKRKREKKEKKKEKQVG